MLLALYYQTTFLQLNTITFLLPFPNAFIPSELSGSRRNDSNSMSTFLENILPINCCSRLQEGFGPTFLQFAELTYSKSDHVFPKRQAQIMYVGQIK